MATGRPVAEILNKITIAITLRKTMKKRRNQLILSLLIKKTDPYNDENSIGSKWSDLTEENEEDIAMTNFIESLKKRKLMRNFFPK